MSDYVSKPERFLSESEILNVKSLANYHKGDNPRRVIAIGDIHGMYAMLYSLMNGISHTLAIEDIRPCNFVFLGDLVDRGPNSAKTIAYVRLLQELMPNQVVVLKGNHEDMLIEEHKRRKHFDGFQSNSMHYYEDQNFKLYHRSTYGSFPNQHIPHDVMEWIKQLPHKHEDEKHYYVHAGLNPRIKYEQQRPSECMWIREEFLQSFHDFGKHVYHGHTPVSKWNGREEVFDVGLHDYRTNLDTAACFGHQLSAAEIVPVQSKPVRIHQVNNQLFYKNRSINVF